MRFGDASAGFTFSASFSHLLSNLSGMFNVHVYMPYDRLLAVKSRFASNFGHFLSSSWLGVTLNVFQREMRSLVCLWYRCSSSARPCQGLGVVCGLQEVSRIQSYGCVVEALTELVSLSRIRTEGNVESVMLGTLSRWFSKFERVS